MQNSKCKIIFGSGATLGQGIVFDTYEGSKQKKEKPSTKEGSRIKLMQNLLSVLYTHFREVECTYSIIVNSKVGVITRRLLACYNNLLDVGSGIV